MKNLWKYLSSLGLMFVAFLCLGIGLKTGEKAEAAKDYDVYVANGSSYTMSSGTIKNGVKVGGTFTMNGGTIQHSGGDGVSVNGTFIMNEGTIQDCRAGVTINYASVGDMTATIYGGTIEGCEDAFRLDERAELVIEGGNISAKANIFTLNMSDVWIYGGSLSGGVIDLDENYGHIDYYGGTIESEIVISHEGRSSAFTLYKEPENVFNIMLIDNSVGSKVVNLKEISSINLSKLNVTNMPSGCQLEIQTINGETWVVVAEKPCKVTLKCNIEGGAKFYPSGSSSSAATDPYVVEVAKGGSFMHHGTQIDLTGAKSNGRIYVTYSSSKFQIDGYWYVNDTQIQYATGYTINEDTTFVFRVKQIKCTITFTAMSVLGNPAHYSTTSSTTSYNSASAQYSIDVDTNSTIQVYQKKIIVGSTTVYVIFKLGQVYSSASITGVLAIYLPTSTSSQTVKITQDVRVIYQGKANYFLAQGEEGESPPEARRGIEVVAKQEKRTIEPAIYIVPSESEIVVKRREK